MEKAEPESVQISFSGDAVRSLRWLREQTRASSIEEVVLDALRVYFTLWDYKDKKNIVIVESGGRKYELKLGMDLARQLK